MAEANPQGTPDVLLDSTGVDPAVEVALMLTEAEYLKVQASLYVALAAGPPDANRSRDLSPLGR